MKYALALLLSFFSTAALAAVDLSISGLLTLIVYIVIIGAIFWAIWWFLGQMGLPQPFDKVARVIVALVALVIVVNLLLGMAGTPMFVVH